MLTDAQIQELIAMPKRILNKEPARGYRREGVHRRCRLALATVHPGNGEFNVFTRQNIEFVENFSIGLHCKTSAHPRGITLVRYNGPHGESSRDPDGHYASPHIHRITQAESAKGSVEPPEKHRELTDRYDTFEEALLVFFSDIGVSNYAEYFDAKRNSFNEHRSR